MQDLNQLAKIISTRKNIPLSEATEIVKNLTKDKTDLGIKLAIANYMDDQKTLGQIPFKGYHETEKIDRIKE